ncbi:histidine phosphatase family protein [Anoxynatronum sibiricum]|uniref:Histidine phosphatase family protein n=1 Tax=Anoxynatronum sibiricum TaxID=210623 RepID=A0ABU9VPW8_9CLOT
MTTIFLMRHGQTEWNVAERFQGSGDSPLTDLGKQEALKAGERLKVTKLSAIYASPRQRAMETAGLVASWHQLPVIPLPDVSEISLGSWEGKHYEEIRTIDPTGYEAFFRQPEAFQGTDGGEDFADVRQRAVNALEALANKHTNTKILVVSHAITIRVLLTHYLNCSINHLWEVAKIRQTSLSEIRFNAKGIQVGLLGCTAHLDE